MKNDLPKVTQPVDSKVSLEPGFLNLNPEFLAFPLVA